MTLVQERAARIAEFIKRLTELASPLFVRRQLSKTELRAFNKTALDELEKWVPFGPDREDIRIVVTRDGSIEPRLSRRTKAAFLKWTPTRASASAGIIRS
jgi:hypothetical protein